VIDLGTNTVRLLVADVETDGAWRAVHAEQRVTRLGEGAEDARALEPAAMARTEATVVDYVTRARALGAVTVRVVGTSAVREAANGRAFARHLATLTRARVDVISGDEEARLTLVGIQRRLDLGRGTVIAFDIGGGSTEYVLARDGRLVDAVSLRLGVVPLTERFRFPGRVDAARYAALLDEIRARLGSELPRTIAEASVDMLVGTAGTVTTLAALDLELAVYDPARVHGHRLTWTSVDRLLARLRALTLDERGALPCLEPGRADLIVPGTAIVMATMERLRVDALVVSEYGLREGIMDDIGDRPS
jgi:exopolyphosphatase/guanosine-5'-triphosphate,3'-diphosphate pyrophosphatase